ncbi:hypothetical protein [Agrobacterium pusense]|uniref:hypothetical protein n=1 Tax=Agrobacterium pusense TaxID=648995 RepID=UPI002898E536|nr:hypothetical protein [Agrobacterium pusense]
MTNHPEAEAILNEFGISVVHPSSVPGIGQTRAVGTVEHIRVTKGADYARFVVMTLAESDNNKGAINRYSLSAASALTKYARDKYPDLMENDLESWFRFWSGTPLPVLVDMILDVHGEAKRSDTLYGMLLWRFEMEFGRLSRQGDFFHETGVTA